MTDNDMRDALDRIIAHANELKRRDRLSARKDYAHTLKTWCECLVDDHGGIRAAARAVDIDPAYFHRMLKGSKHHPTPATLKKLGLDSTPHYRLAIHCKKEQQT